MLKKFISKKLFQRNSLSMFDLALSLYMPESDRFSSSFNGIANSLRLQWESWLQNNQPHDSAILLERIKLFGLRKSPVIILSDGNCQFASLAYHLYGNPDLHGQVRSEIFDWLV